MNCLYIIVKIFLVLTVIVTIGITFDDFMAGRRRARARAKFTGTRFNGDKYK